MTSTADWLRTLHSDGVQPAMTELLYYRSKVPAFARHARLTPRQGMAGGLVSRSKGRGMEFDEVRHYQAGDDVRAIDWRVTARTGQTHTKLYREEKERPVFIVTDLSASLLFGSQLLLKSVQACHLAAALAWQAEQRGDRVGGLVFNGQGHQQLKPTARQRGVLHYLHSLLAIHQQSLQQWQQQADEQTPSYRLEDALQQLRQLAKPGSIIHIISDSFQCQHGLQSLAGLRKHCDIRLYLLTDPLELQLPSSLQPQPLDISDGRRQQTLWLDQATRQRYSEQAGERLQRAQTACRHAGIRAITVSAASALEQQWPELMR
ncbi:DUF58 domain-containing protein [Idiomarina xiamenensis]|uniref:von Willebrand factor A n=1 Tax=Idiomarina xiamenensis 10-D-4 TaxID=740709 RepID=K2L1T1_9GAMM|nr:DUF58 domain-containing protein [Idiomarina xiamenensis]EKE83805.1 von Willebrand factor A [Idiomarina xiamenensis 10-D-4]